MILLITSFYNFYIVYKKCHSIDIKELFQIIYFLEISRKKNLLSFSFAILTIF